MKNKVVLASQLGLAWSFQSQGAHFYRMLRGGCHIEDKDKMRAWVLSFMSNRFVQTKQQFCVSCQ